MLLDVRATWFPVSVLQPALPAEHEGGVVSLGIETVVLLLMVSMASWVVIVERPAGQEVLVWSAEIS